jgi:hypothetical protein
MSALKQRIEDIFFQKDGNKTTVNKKLLRNCSYGFGAIGILAILIGEPAKTIVRKKTLPSLSTLNTAPSYKIPEHTVQKKNNKGGESRPRVDKFPGPLVVARPGAGEIMPGTISKGILQTPATDGPVKAVLAEDIIANGDVKIPTGSILLGLGQSQQFRVTIKFFKAILNNNQVLEIDAIALDQEDQLVGLQSSKFDSDAVKLGSSIGLNFVGGVAQGLKERSGENGASVEKNTTSNALLNGAAQASLEHSKYLLESAKNEKVSLSVDSGIPLLIFFNGSK